MARCSFPRRLMGQLGHGPSGSIVFSPSSQLSTTIQGLSSSVGLFLWDHLISVLHQPRQDGRKRETFSFAFTGGHNCFTCTPCQILSQFRSGLIFCFLDLVVGQPLSSPAVRVFVVCVFGTLPDYKLQT